MKYIIFVIDDASGSGSGDEMVAIDAFNDQLRTNGHWIYAAGIGAPTSARLINGMGSSPSVQKRSLFSGDEHYSGFWLIEADTPARAEELAIQGSAACNRRVELRPFLR